jgi:glycosyltransferase involved in cell wall biosynthesis
MTGAFSAAGIRVHVCNEQRDSYEDRLQQLYRALRIFHPSVVMSILGVESFEMLKYLPLGVLRVGVILDVSIQPNLFVPRYSPSMDHIAVIARYLVPEITRLKNRPPVSYVQLGIPIPRNVAPREPNPNAPLRLLYYGRLDDFKGVPMFPKIAAALKRRNVRYIWTIHGTGPKENYVRDALVKEIEEGKVCFSSPVAFERLPLIVRAHDIYILTSTYEGGPLTLLESMALGLVPVCGDIPGLVEDVIICENGFRVPRAEADAYAERIAMLDADRDLLERMSVAAHRTITATFSNESMARRYVQLFNSLAKPGGSRAWLEKITPIRLSGMAAMRWSPFGRSLRRIRKRLRALGSHKW